KSASVFAHASGSETQAPIFAHASGSEHHLSKRRQRHVVHPPVARAKLHRVQSYGCREREQFRRIELWLRGRWIGPLAFPLVGRRPLPLFLPPPCFLSPIAPGRARP